MVVMCFLWWWNRKFLLFMLNLTLKAPQNNRDLNHGILHPCTKFNGPSLNRWRVQTSSKWGKFGIQFKFDLEGQCQSLIKTIGILTKIFYTSEPNLVTITWTSHKLSRGQASDWHTHTRADTGNDNTRRPKLVSGKDVEGCQSDGPQRAQWRQSTLWNFFTPAHTATQKNRCDYKVYWYVWWNCLLAVLPIWKQFYLRIPKHPKYILTIKKGAFDTSLCAKYDPEFLSRMIFPIIDLSSLNQTHCLSQNLTMISR